MVSVEYKNVCYTLCSSFSWVLCRCLCLHSLYQDIILLLMLVPPPGMPFTCIPTCWNPNDTSLSLSHMSNSLEMLSVPPHVGLFQLLRDVMSFFIYIYKNCDLVLAYKANIAIFLFLQLDCICWHQDLYWIWLFLIRITCGALRQRNFHWELRFLTQAREIYGKCLPYYLGIRYIRQRQTQQMDPIAINTTSNGQHLILMGQTPPSTA